ncbi:MAG: hypothetical protein ACRDH5_12315 [bacterium]
MAPPPDVTRSLVFVFRVHRERGMLRGQVVAVADGATRLFDDFDDAMAFVRARLDPRKDPALEGEARSKLAEEG